MDYCYENHNEIYKELKKCSCCGDYHIVKEHRKDINNKKILLKDTYRMMYNKPTHKIARNKKGKREVKRIENNSRRKKEKRSVSQRTR